MTRAQADAEPRRPGRGGAAVRGDRRAPHLSGSASPSCEPRSTCPLPTCLPGATATNFGGCEQRPRLPWGRSNLPGATQRRSARGRGSLAVGGGAGVLQGVPPAEVPPPSAPPPTAPSPSLPPGGGSGAGPGPGPRGERARDPTAQRGRSGCSAVPGRGPGGEGPARFCSSVTRVMKCRLKGDCRFVVRGPKFGRRGCSAARAPSLISWLIRSP